VTGTAILVHGGWSCPGDWQFVSALLRHESVDVITPDLPSHTRPRAAREDDVAAVVQEALRASPPIVIVGWSYGGAVISDLETPPPVPVERLVFVGWIPVPVHPSEANERPSTEPDIEHILFPDSDHCVLDDEWWLTHGDGADFPEHIRAHLMKTRRRPISLAAALAPPVREAWRHLKTTLLLGANDQTVSPALQRWASDHFADVQVVDGDHFLPFLRPDVVANTILAALPGPDR